MVKFSVSRVAIGVASLMMVFSLAGTGRTVVKAADASGEYEVITQEEQGTVTPKVDAEEALEGFMLGQKGLNSKGIIRNVQRKTYLSGANAMIYNEILEASKEIANGNRSSTEITYNFPLKTYLGSKWKDKYTAADLGVNKLFQANGELTSEASAAISNLFSYDPKLIIESLLTDNPYEFYWFGNSYSYPSGLEYSYDGTHTFIKLYETIPLTFRLCVSADYSASGAQKTCVTSTAKCKAVVTAANTANSIIAANVRKSDYEKLIAYRDKICELNTYNYDAANNSSTPYGDPWQLIYVFDNNPNTNVVCEGYSKAFKYLCDGSSFKSSIIECYLITGNLVSSNSSGGHMWNHIRMDDGKYYLIDVTNCDGDSVGYPDKLFLKGMKKQSSNVDYISKYIESLGYAFDSRTTSLFTTAELTLSAEDYMVVEAGEQDESPEYKIVFDDEGTGGVVEQGKTLVINADLVNASDGSQDNVPENIWVTWIWQDGAPFEYMIDDSVYFDAPKDATPGKYKLKVTFYDTLYNTRKVIATAEYTITITQASQNPSGQGGSDGDSNPSGQGGSDGDSNPSGQGGSGGDSNPSGQGGSDGDSNPSGQGGSDGDSNPSDNADPVVPGNPSGQGTPSGNSNPSGNSGSGQNNASGDDKSGAQKEGPVVLPPDGKVSDGGIDFNVNDSGEASVSKAPSIKVKKISIGDYVNFNGQTFKVVAISSNAYKNCKKLIKVTLGSNIKKIGAGAFKGCGNLKQVTVKGNNLKSVGGGSFKGIKKGCKITIVCKDKKTFDTLVKKFKKAGAKNARFIFKKG